VFLSLSEEEEEEENSSFFFWGKIQEKKVGKTLRDKRTKKTKNFAST